MTPEKKGGYSGEGVKPEPARPATALVESHPSDDEFTRALGSMQSGLRKRTTVLTAFNIFTTLVAIGTLVVTYMQSRSTQESVLAQKRSTDAQLEAFKLQYRPWLAVQEFAGPAFDGSPIDAVQVSLKNLGTLPVQGSFFVKLAWISAAKVGPPTFDELYGDDRADENQTSHFAFGAGQWVASQVTVKGATYDPRVFSLAKQGSTTLFICLRADYTGPDGSPGPWTYRMCFRYIPLRDAWSAYPPPNKS